MNAPFLELGLYFADGDPQAHLLDVVEVLLRSGGELEAFLLHREGDAEPQVGVGVTLQDVRRLRDAAGVAVSRALVRKAIGLIAGAETVSLLDRASMLREPLGVKDNGDPSPVVVESSAAAFVVLPGESNDKRRARSAGRTAVRRFRLLTDALEPSYATLTIERPLLTPLEPSVVDAPACFDDFYMSRAFLGEQRFARFLEVVSCATVEHTASGAYVWTSPTFGSSLRLSDADALRLRRGVGQLVRAAGAGR